MKTQLFIFLTLLIISIATATATANDILITDGDIESGDNVTWTKDNTYFLDGYVFVEAGACLTIEAGTVIKGLNVPNTGDQTSVLIIAKGAKIIACGTEENPIIFTAEADDINKPFDLSERDRGLWGGVVILGCAPIGVPGGRSRAEGIPDTEGRSTYGGDNPEDNSGKLKYISIRHGGAVLGSNNRASGLMLGGIGNGTRIDCIDIFACLGNGLSTLGGTISMSFLSVGFVSGDSYSFSQAYNGACQFVFSIQGETDGNGIAYGDENGEFEESQAIGRIYNGTFIGSSDRGSSTGISIRENAAVELWNCIFVDHPKVVYEFQEGYRQGQTRIESNYAFNFGELFTGNPPEIFQVNENDPLITSISREPTNKLIPLLLSESTALMDASIDENRPSEVDITSYVGAFDNKDNWLTCWTSLYEYNYLELREDCPLVSTKSNKRIDFSITLAPNPTSSSTILDFDLPKHTAVDVKILDQTGRLVHYASYGKMAVGKHKKTLEVEHLNTGLYLMVLETEYGIGIRKITVHKSVK